MEMTSAKEIKRVYDMLQDEESKTLFMYRLRYFLDRNIEHLFDVMRFSYRREIRMMQERGIKRNTIIEFLNGTNKQKPVLYATGFAGQAAMAGLLHSGVDIECFCDTDEAKQNELFHGFKVVSPNTLLSEYINNPVIITSADYEKEIYQILKNMGIDNNRIYFITSLEKQYFGPEFIRPNSDEVYIDAGPHNGHTILDFINFSGGKYKKIYGLEPDFENYNKTRRTLNGLPNIEIIKKGAWDKTDILSFSGNNAAGSCIDPNGVDKIEVTAIDEILNGSPATFIKMDIEGAELNALRGARKTIEKYHPRLAICIYHKPEDILEIPLYISSIVPQYKFYIRHYQLYYYSETVLYAVM